jgi:CheY-like chemotaxis protein
MKILIIDDHEGFREAIRDILVKNSHSADTAASAVEAIPLAESGNYDLILVDFQMPEHDGFWFMRNVKLPRKTKALLVTGHVDKAIIREMFKVGVSGYVIKPFDEDDLLHHLVFYQESAKPS